MNPHNPLRANRTTFILVMVLIFFIGLLIAIEASAVFGSGAIAAKIFHEIGHAAMVAAVLGLTVDAYSKNRHEIWADEVTRKINTDVIGAIYGQQFPAAIREEVRKNFLEQRIHREDLNVTYAFAPLEGSADRLLLTEQSSFKFVNSSDHDVTLPLRAYVECPIEEELRLQCRILSTSINGVPLLPQELMGTFSADGMELTWQKEIVVPAGGSKEISSSCQTIKYARDVEIWSTLYPSDGITLNVSLDVRLNVFAKCVNSGTLKQEVDQKHFKRWKLDNGMFPGQSLTFWWSPVDIPPAEAQQAEAPCD